MYPVMIVIIILSEILDYLY